MSHLRTCLRRFGKEPILQEIRVTVPVIGPQLPNSINVARTQQDAETTQIAGENVFTC